MRVSSSGGWTSVTRPHSKRLLQAVLEGGEALGRAVGRDHDLTAGAVQGIERMKELLLGRLLALHELDVVDEEDIAFTVAPLELIGGVGSEGVDEFVRERLGRGIAQSNWG